jgi:hypothetical protein
MRKEKPIMNRNQNEPREIRRALCLSQTAFWARLGITQSGGSRYEHGRKIPKAVRELLEIVYIRGINTEKFESDDFSIITYLKAKEPDLYRSLQSASRVTRN